MNVGFHRTFDKQFKQLRPAQKERTKRALLLFMQDPENPLLRNHPLKGQWSRYRSISAGGDLRLHYRILNKYVVLFVAVGTHNQLYR